MTWNWPSYIAGVLTLPGLLAVVASYYYWRVTEGVGKPRRK